MSLVLQKKGDATSSITLDFSSISEDTSSSKMKVGTGTGIPVYIRFGFEKTITATGTILSATDYAKLKAWDGDTILDCTTSTYPEIVISSGTYYLIVDKIKLSRKGGYLNRWDYSITLIQDTTGTKFKRWT